MAYVVLNPAGCNTGSPATDPAPGPALARPGNRLRLLSIFQPSTCYRSLNLVPATDHSTKEPVIYYLSSIVQPYLLQSIVQP
jgi:hypothetical protein